MSRFPDRLMSFLEELLKRLVRGAMTYGDASFSKSLPDLVRECQEEALDIAGWSYPLYVRLSELRERVAQLEKRAEWLDVTLDELEKQ